MFLLKRATTVVLLVTLFGILLPDVYIQPARAQTEEAQHDAEIQGRMCYDCVPCKSNTDLGNERGCLSHETHCYYGKRQVRGGKEEFVRGCADAQFVKDYSCDHFTFHGDRDIGYRACSCRGDRCNTGSLPSRGGPDPSPTGAPSASSQLLLILCLPVAIYTFGSLMN